MRNKTKNAKCYRKPKTTQERRINGRRSKWARAKRNQKNLIDAWEDSRTCIQKTWKVKRKTQYYPDGRGQKHTIIIPEYSDTPQRPSWQRMLHIWQLESWFLDHEIPYRIEHINKLKISFDTHGWKYVPVGTEKRTVTRRIRPKKKKGITQYETYTYHVTKYEHRLVKLSKPRKVCHRTRLGYEVTWWSHKPIDIQRIIEKFTSPI